MSVVDSFAFTEHFAVTSEIQKNFDENGFVIIRSVLSRDEVNKTTLQCMHDPATIANGYGREDGGNRMTKLALWNQPGDNVSGTVPRMHKVVGTMETLMGGHEMYHYHSKLMMKEAEIGGQHVWHQDYGYWYKNGCLFPYMGSVFIALDKCTQENSCLQVLKGSHLCGRIEHGLVGNEGEYWEQNIAAKHDLPSKIFTSGAGVKQQGADVERVEMISKVCPQVPVELDPGDAVYFHCNLLHCSKQNFSKKRRWAMICSFNQARNNPTLKHHHPFYTRLDRLPNDALMKCDRLVSTVDKDYLNPFDDFSVKS